MVKHIVLFKFDEKIPSSEKKKKIKEMEDVLLGLKNKIEVLKKIEVYIKASEAPESVFDIMLSTEFDSFQDLDNYRVHPDHMKVVEFIKSLNLQRAAIDYKS